MPYDMEILKQIHYTTIQCYLSLNIKSNTE